MTGKRLGGIKGWWQGRDDTAERPPMTIQQVEELLTKRKAEWSGAVVLTIGGDDYCLLSREDYDRIMTTVEAVEAMHKILLNDAAGRD